MNCWLLEHCLPAGWQVLVQLKPQGLLAQETKRHSHEGPPVCTVLCWIFNMSNLSNKKCSYEASMNIFKSSPVTYQVHQVQMVLSAASIDYDSHYPEDSAGHLHLLERRNDSVYTIFRQRLNLTVGAGLQKQLQHDALKYCKPYKYISLLQWQHTLSNTISPM